MLIAVCHRHVPHCLHDMAIPADRGNDSLNTLMTQSKVIIKFLNSAAACSRPHARVSQSHLLLLGVRSPASSAQQVDHSRGVQLRPS
jgi:hypothetical protein